MWGFVFFAETPDLLTVGGMVLITVAGLTVAAPRSQKASARKAPVDEAGMV